MHQQLTFDLLLNPSVTEAEEGRLCAQGRAMLGLFRSRDYMGLTVSTIDLAEIGCQYNARLWEVRRFLIPQGLCIDLIAKDPVAAGVNHYKIVTLSKSTYYAQHRDKLEARRQKAGDRRA